MKKTGFIILFLIVVSFVGNSKNAICADKDKKAKIIPLNEMTEFSIRGGLPNLFHKINTQRQVRIGYIGGSITEMPMSWRELTFYWLRSTYPLTAFYEINAAIGGTGSGLGAFRMENDLLSEKPDLIFVEFAVNGTGYPPYNSRESMVRTMEGIVRKAWKTCPNTDICFVYTTAMNMCNDLVKGKLQQPSEFMEEVADYYEIPTIHMGIQVAKLLVEGKLVFRADPSENANTIVFTRDGTHALPESGQPIYASTVIKYLKEMSMFPDSKPHILPKPMIDDNWEYSRMINISETNLTGDWYKLPENHELMQKFKKYMPNIYQAKPGSSMHFKFKGKVLGIYDCIGPGTGTIQITVDGESQDIYRFDQWCGDYRKHNFFIKELEDKEHDVVIKVQKKAIDKEAIMLKRKQTITDPSKFAGLDWYPANVMIVGDLIK